MIINDDLLIPKYEDILNDLENRFKPILQMGVNDKISPESVAGQIISNIATQEYEIYLSFQALISQMDAQTAKGGWLDFLGSLRGLERKTNESDDDFRLRISGYSSILPNKYKRFDTLTEQLNNINGVIKANVVYQNGAIYPIISANNSINWDEVAQVLRDYAPIGKLEGNKTINYECNEYKYTEAKLRVVELQIKAVNRADNCICNKADFDKIKELILTKSCNYNAGSLISQDHFKSFLGLNGYVIDSVYFKLQTYSQLNLNPNQQAIINNDPCLTTNLASELLNQACLNAPCNAIEGNEVSVPIDTVPIFCEDKITFV